MRIVEETTESTSISENRELTCKEDVFSGVSTFITNEGIDMEARTINIIRIRVPEREGAEILINSQELGPGVFAGNCVSTVMQGYVNLIVINYNSATVAFKEHRIAYENMTNFEGVPMNEKDNKIGCNVAIMSIVNPEIQTRVNELRMQLQVGENLSNEEYESISSFCEKFHDLFHMDGDKLTHTSVIKHTIPIKTDQPPIHQKMYRLPPPLFKEEINKQVRKLLENDIVVHSKSPWSSPLLIVPKKAGVDGEKKWRMVVDFRKLN